MTKYSRTQHGCTYTISVEPDEHGIVPVTIEVLDDLLKKDGWEEVK